MGRAAAVWKTRKVERDCLNGSRLPDETADGSALVHCADSIVDDCSCLGADERNRFDECQG